MVVTTSMELGLGLMSIVLLVYRKVNSLGIYLSLTTCSRWGGGMTMKWKDTGHQNEEELEQVDSYYEDDGYDVLGRMKEGRHQM